MNACLTRERMGWVKGLEPSTYGTTTRRSSQLSYTHHVLLLLQSA